MIDTFRFLHKFLDIKLLSQYVLSAHNFFFTTDTPYILSIGLSLTGCSVELASLKRFVFRNLFQPVTRTVKSDPYPCTQISTRSSSCQKNRRHLCDLLSWRPPLPSSVEALSSKRTRITVLLYPRPLLFWQYPNWKQTRSKVGFLHPQNLRLGSRTSLQFGLHPYRNLRCVRGR